MSKQLFTTCLLSSDGRAESQLAFHPSSPRLAVVGLEPNRISVADCSSGALCQSLSIAGEIGGLTFDEFGEHLMAISHDRIWIWQFVSPQPIQHDMPNIAEYDLYCSSPTFFITKNGIWAFFSNEWQLWSLAEGRITSRMPGPRGEKLLRVAQTKSGICVAVTYDEQCFNHSSPTISVWNLDELICLHQITLIGWHDVLVSHDANLAVAHQPECKESITVWDLRHGDKLSDVKGLFSCRRAAFAATNSHFISDVPNDVSVPWTWISITNLQSGDQRFVDPGTPFPPALFTSPYANLFVTIANDNRHPIDLTSFWDLSGNRVGWSTGHSSQTSFTGFSPSGDWFATVIDPNGTDTMVNAVPAGSVIVTDLRALKP